MRRLVYLKSVERDPDDILKYLVSVSRSSRSVDVGLAFTTALRQQC